MSEANSTSTSIISIDDLFEKYAEIKNGHRKPIAILRGTTGIVSMIASSLLILTIFRSPKRLTTTYHRLLLGMSIGDILYSLSQSTFQASSPSDVSYIVWNARGNQATCIAQGVITVVGWVATLYYSCSLNLYYLALVKHNKTETYIRTKIEPFLHGIPISIALIWSITFLVNKNYNDAGDGICTTNPIYNPPHCVGYDEGEVREGFEIPCGRGSNGKLYFWSRLLLGFVPPIIICLSLGMIYRSVAKQEEKIAKYGRGMINLSTQQTSVDDSSERANMGNGSRRGSIVSIVSSMSRRFGRSGSSNPHAGDGNNSNSRAVMHKALAYSIAYFLTWIWWIIGFIMFLAGAEIPLPYRYIWTCMVPLQGLFNFLVYLHPKVMKAKRSPGQNISWYQALGIAFWSGINWPKKKTNAPPAHAAGSNNKDTPHLAGDNEKTSPAAAASDGKVNNAADDGANSLKAKYKRESADIEEEKTDIQAPQCSDDWDDNNA